MPEPTTPTPQQVLDLPMRDNDAHASTIRGYLVALLAVVWEDGECFSGKRPFGYSCWEWELYRALVDAGAIAGTFDDWGGLDDCDRPAADKLIAAAIKTLGER